MRDAPLWLLGFFIMGAIVGSLITAIALAP